MEEAKPKQRTKSSSSRSTTSMRSDTSSQSSTPRASASVGARPTSSSQKTNTITTLKGLKCLNNRSNAGLTSNGGIITNFPKQNISRNTNTLTPKRKPTSRGVSPMSRPILPTAATMPEGFSNEAPQNLITSVTIFRGRATSTTGGKPGSTTIEQKSENIKPAMRRQSCSPNVTRGRLMVATNNSNNSSGNGTMVIGSRMVEKMMNARDKDSLVKHQNQANEKAGNDKLMLKAMMDKVFKKQLDMSSKNPDGKNPDGVKSSTNANSTAPKTKLGNQTIQGLQERNFRVQAGNESKFPINKSTETRTRHK